MAPLLPPITFLHSLCLFVVSENGKTGILSLSWIIESLTESFPGKVNDTSFLLLFEANVMSSREIACFQYLLFKPNVMSFRETVFVVVVQAKCYEFPR